MTSWIQTAILVVLGFIASWVVIDRMDTKFAAVDARFAAVEKRLDLLEQQMSDIRSYFIATKRDKAEAKG